MIVALDTSALLKLLFAEVESDALRDHLAGATDDTFVVSTLAVTEMQRAAIRTGTDPNRVAPVIEPFTVVSLREGMLELAGHLPARHLGTLDAVHIASALAVGAAAIVTYDQRQGSAARAEGLLVVTPGASPAA